jgi:1-aminocyclopropane-1-carboxylate deaminase
LTDIENSPVSEVLYESRKIFIKRDDLLDSEFSGNKARKFHYFLINDFPYIKKVVSYGSNQSNAMYSLSVLCKLKNWEFEYYTDHLPSFLLENPTGNLKYALQNGMKLKLFKDCLYNELNSKNTLSNTVIKNDILFIPEGGRCQTSKYGISRLAKEIIQFKTDKNLTDLTIFLPSGTGTTALFLQQSIKELNDNSKVYTNACVGGKKYLKKQFFKLDDNEADHPVILDTKKHHFGKLDCKMYQFWIELQKKLKIEFDLLYDPLGFWYMMEFLRKNDIPGEVMYIHQGGLKGNISMVQRYKRKCGENFQYK